jgi:hypothetical protein
MEGEVKAVYQGWSVMCAAHVSWTKLEEDMKTSSAINTCGKLKIMYDSFFAVSQTF